MNKLQIVSVGLLMAGVLFLFGCQPLLVQLLRGQAVKMIEQQGKVVFTVPQRGYAYLVGLQAEVQIAPESFSRNQLGENSMGGNDETRARGAGKIGSEGIVLPGFEKPQQLDLTLR